MLKKRAGKKSKEPIPIETLVAEYLAGAAEAAKRWRGVDFNFSPETVSILDEMLEELYTEIHRPSLKKRFGLGANEVDIAQWANLWGIYLGEILRREYNGRWISGHEEGPSLLAVEFDNGTVIFPTARLFRRLADGAKENLVDYVDLVRREMTSEPADTERGMSEE